MKIDNRLFRLTLILSSLAIVFLTFARISAQVSNIGVSISFKKPSLPPGAPDPFKNLWFQMSYGAGDYDVDVSDAYPKLKSNSYGTHPVYLSGTNATAILIAGSTAEVCGEMPYQNNLCISLKPGVVTKLDAFVKVKELKVQKIRPTDQATLWENANFLGRFLDVGIGANDISRLDFRIINSLWVPPGHWVMLCDQLSANRKLCGPGRGTRGFIYKSDNNFVQPDYHDAPRRQYKYAIVGTGEPPPEPQPLPRPNPLPKMRPKRF